MIQLKVYENTARLTQYWLDLYDAEPIKLTLSIEDITNADATSTYSKAFKVPGTRKNNEFFKQAFEINGVLFDVTVKKPAVILVDGAEFRQGHIRLNKMIKNTELDRYDYELVFLGETRDFSSIIGDSPLCALDMTDITGGIGGVPLSKADIQYSWDAYPEGPNLTSGLHDGNIIYPLVDHGNTYADTGAPLQPEVRNNANPLGKPFTNPANPLNINQMKPVIRAKRIWDQIFEDAGYTYSSSFIDSPRFHQMYVSAFGNEALPAYNPTAASEYNFAASEPASAGNYQGFGTQFAVAVETDPSDSWVFDTYTAAATGTYTFTGSVYFYGYNEIISSWPPAYSPEYGSLCIHVNGNPTPVACGNYAQQSTSSVTHTLNLNTGDQVTFRVAGNDGITFVSCSAQSFACTSSPGNINPVSLLECTYKQIDFIKDILLMFRLVLSPDPNDPRNFIVEPWQTYINSGQLYDWSKKLVEEKDVVVEPVFFTQSDQITFTQPTDGDWINIYHQQSYKHNWGWLQFDSNNELLKGTRDVKVIGIANTPMTQVEGQGTTSSWIVPQIHVHSTDDGPTKHLPIKARTRLVFYNGLQATPVSWYLVDNAPINNYPLISQYETWPITPGSLNLAFSNDVQYWGTGVAGYNLNGSTLYDSYWSRYVSSLYNKFSRRVTAYFVLNNIDLNTFSFDDTIFVNGVYYIPEKIIDLQIGAYTEVQVQLLTANDYVPTFTNETLFATVEGVNTNCLGEGGQINVECGGAGPINWTLSNGQSGQFNNYSPPPYSFNISTVLPGSYTLTLTDQIGRTVTLPVTVPLGSSPTTTHVVTNSTPGLCNGAITVTPIGTGPFTIFWSDQYPLAGTFERTNLCCGPYSYFVRDVNGCESPAYLVQVECPPPTFIYEAHAYGKKCNTLSGTEVIVQSSVPLPINDGTVFGLDTIQGCFAIVATSTLTPIANVVSTYPSCEVCNEPTPIEIHKDWYFFSQFQLGSGTEPNWVPNISVQSIFDRKLTDAVRDYYMPLDPQPAPPQIIDEVSTTQNLSTAFQYLLNTVGYVMPGTQRFIWPGQINGFSWNDPNTASPQVKLDNGTGGYRYYVAVKNSIFNDFFEYNALTEKWIGPKMWTAQDNAQFVDSVGRDSGSYEQTKSFTLGGVGYTLLLSENTANLATSTYGTDPLCYLKFATTPAPTPTPTPTVVPLTYYYNIAPYDPTTTCTPGANVNPIVKSETLIEVGTTVKIGNIDPAALELINDYTCYEITYRETYGYAQADVVSIYDTCEQCQGSITPTECTAYTIYNGSQADEPYSYTACDGTPVQSFIGGFNYDGPFCAQTGSFSSNSSVFITDEFACGSPVVCSAYTIYNTTKSSKFYAYIDCDGNSIEGALGGRTTLGPFCAQTNTLDLTAGIVIQDETACEPALYHYEVEECNTLEVKIIQSQYLLNAGDVYSITGFPGCWKVTIQSIASGVFPEPEAAWISCGACNGLPSGNFLTDNKPRNGAPFPACAVDHTRFIYNFDVTDPQDLQIGMTMWADPSMTTVWNGASLWYSIANGTNPSNPIVTVLINSIGVILDISMCGSATCFSYTQGGYDIGSCVYLDCDGNMSGADYNGPSASGFDATTFCAIQIIEWSGNEPVQNGSIC